MPAGSDHDDINLNQMNPFASQNEYNNNVTILLASYLGGNFDECHKLTGLTKPSIFNGLHIPTLAAPCAFPVDIMLLFAPNIPDLLLRLWCGTFTCNKSSDSTTQWPWKVLTGKTWTEHGEKVAQLRSYLPSSYE